MGGYSLTLWVIVWEADHHLVLIQSHQPNTPETFSILCTQVVAEAAKSLFIKQ